MPDKKYVICIMAAIMVGDTPPAVFMEGIRSFETTS